MARAPKPKRNTGCLVAVVMAIAVVGVVAIAYGTGAFALRAEPPAASHRFAHQSPIAG